MKLCGVMLRISFSLTSSRPADEPEIVELGHLVLHDGRAVPQLGAVVLVVARSQCDYRPVRHVAQRDHLERLWSSQLFEWPFDQNNFDLFFQK